MSLSLSWLMVLLCNFFYVLNAFFIITLTVMAGVMLFMAYRLFTEDGTRRVFAYLFIGYAAAVFVVTLFARLGTSNNAVYVDIVKSLSDAVSMAYPEKTEHLLLNILMFVPFSALYMLITPSQRQLDEYAAVNGLNEDEMPYVSVRFGSAAFFLGMAYSAIIESTQLALSMGECDMADVFANTLGTLIGILIGIAGRRFIKYQ
jgi:glycopeptide antibiotics resistance protein